MKNKKGDGSARGLNPREGAVSPLLLKGNRDHEKTI